MPELRVWIRDHREALTNIFCTAAIILLPWQARLMLISRELGGIRSEYDTISVYAGSLILAIAIGFLWYTRRAYPNMLLAGKALLIWLAITILLASDKPVSLYTGIMALVAFGYFIIGSAWGRERVMRAIIASGLLQAAIAWQQFADQKIVSSTFLGVAEHMPSVLGQSVVMINGQRILRAYGLLPHPNMLAPLLAVSFGLVLYYWILHARQDVILQKAWSRVLLMSAGVFLFSGLLISFSRSGLVAVIVLLGGWLLYGVLTKRVYQIQHVWRVALLCGMLLIVFSVVADGIWLQRFGLTEAGEQSRLERQSITERIVSYREAEILMTTRVVIGGLGMGNYIPRLVQAIPSLPAYAYQPVHNAYVMALLEIGVIGLALLAWFIVSLFPKQVWKRGMSDILGYYPLSLVALIMVMALFDHFFWTSYFGQSLWWLVLGLAAGETT